VGCPKSPLHPELDEQLTTDDNYIWTYTSPEFPMLKVSLTYMLALVLGMIFAAFYKLVGSKMIHPVLGKCSAIF
jgi:hypothetical protein